MFATPVTTIPAGCLTEGDEVAGFGTIEQVSFTAYRFGSQWVPFQKVHGRPAPTMPLVVLR